MTDTIENDANLMSAVSALRQALKGLSRPQRLKALKMVGSEDDFVVRGLMQTIAAQSVAIPRSGVTPKKETFKGPKGGPPPNPINQTPEVIDAKRRLKESNAKVRAEAKKLGVEALDETNEILIDHRRLQSFLKDSKVRGGFRPSTDLQQTP